MAETWGLLIDWIGNDYTQTIVDTALNYCQNRGVSLVVYTIGPLNLTLEAEEFHSFVLPLTEDPRLDRILICPAQMSSRGGLRILESHFRTFTSKPVVCLGGPLCDFPMVQANIETAFVGLLDHLFHHHGYRRFAWVGGPPDNPEGHERERIFRKYLEDHALTLNQQAMISGNFTATSGRSVAVALATCRNDWDVVVVANDTMAVVLHEILGPQVPLTGFDNSPAAKEYGLTTIEPNLGKLVEKALSVLGHPQDSLGQKLYRDDSATLVRRSSCGCERTAETIPRSNTSDPTTERLGVFAQNLLDCRELEALERYLNNFLPGEYIYFWKLIPPWERGSSTFVSSPILPPLDKPVEPLSLVVHTLSLDNDLWGYLVLDLSHRDYFLSDWIRLQLVLLMREWHRDREGVQVRKMLKLEIEKLGRRKADIEAIVNSLPVWIVELDQRFHIHYMNRSGASLLGLSMGEARNRQFLDFVDPADRESVERRLRHCRDTKIKTSCEFAVVSDQTAKASVVCEAEPLTQGRYANLSSLFGSLSFEGGLRLTGLEIRPLLEGMRDPDDDLFRHFQFSKRQKEIVSWLAKGLEVSEVAQKMELTEATIRVQLHNIYLKTGVTKKRELLDLLSDYQVKSALRPF